MAVAEQGRLGAFLEEFHEFVSPFKTPAFWWLWVQGFVGTVGGIIQGCFMFYWCTRSAQWQSSPRVASLPPHHAHTYGDTQRETQTETDTDTERQTETETDRGRETETPVR